LAKLANSWPGTTQATSQTNLTDDFQYENIGPYELAIDYIICNVDSCPAYALV